MTTAPAYEGKEREVRVGDGIVYKISGYSRMATVTKVTEKYIWLKCATSLFREHHIIKCHRDIVLIGTKYY